MPRRFKVEKLYRQHGGLVVEGFASGSMVKVKCKALVLAAALETPRLLTQIDDENIRKKPLH
ncbi:MAG: hypothetical protein QW701_06145 [Candidatus Nezhaarchaeales archaeon]